MVRTRFAVAVLCTGLLAGCGNLGSFGGHTRVSVSEDSEQPQLDQVSAHWRDVVITLEGQVAPPGLCPRLSGDDGRIHGIVGSLRAFKPGTRVRVTGPTAVWSGCPLGSVIRADKIEPLGGTEQRLSQAPVNE